MKYHLVDTATIFVDSTHVKACANSKKMRKHIAKEQAMWFEEELKKEINEDRELHGKKPLKDKKDYNDQPPSSAGGIRKKKQKHSLIKSKHKNAAQQTQKVAGSKKGNISMSLPMQ